MAATNRLCFHVFQQGSSRDHAKNAAFAGGLAALAGAVFVAGVWRSNQALMGIGGVATGLLGAASAILVWLWLRARRLGTLAVSLVDTREAAGDGGGFECRVQFGDGAERTARATLRGWRLRRGTTGSSARVQDGPDFFHESIELSSVAAGHELLGRFPVPSRADLPPTTRTGTITIVWQMELELVAGGRRFRLLYPMVVEPAG